MSIEQQLRMQLSKAFGSTPWDENPLVTIGLSHAILGLKVTDQQLYRIVRSYIRQLVAAVHPDVNVVRTEVQTDDAKKILVAFDLLDREETFLKALEEFRILKSDERSEIGVLRAGARSLKSRLAGIENQIDAVVRGQKALVIEKGIFAREKREHAVIAQEREREREVLLRRVSHLKTQIENKLNESRPWKLKFEQLATYTANLGKEKGDGIFAFEARWIVVAYLRRGVISRSLTAVDRFGTARREFSQAARDFPLELPKLLNLWQKVEKRFGRPDAGEITKGSRHWSLGISLIHLRAGEQEVVYGDRTGSSGRVIGSIPPAVLGCVKRSHLKSILDQDHAWGVMSPFLVRGGLLLSISVDPTKRYVWSRTCPEFRINTKRFILALG